MLRVLAPRCLVVFCLLATPCATAPAAEEARPTKASQHAIWEGVFGAAADAAPDTALSLEVTAPSGQKRTVPGFWDGGKTWKVRFRPDEVGKYAFKSISKPAVAGLDAVAGMIDVTLTKGSRFLERGPLRVAKARTHLEHADGTPFFFLADTAWTGPALSSEDDWDHYLKDRVTKKFTAVQFNALSPWRTAPTDAEGRVAYTLQDGKLLPNPDFFRRLDTRINQVNDAGLLAVPVLAWAHKKGDLGVELNEEQLVTLLRYELARYDAHHVLYVLAGDNRYTPDEAAKWKRIGRAVFADYPDRLVTTHPTGMNFPWAGWDDEKWLTVFGYQSGHGDGDAALKWIHSGPPAEYGRRKGFTRPVINLEPPYEDHNGYQSRRPHSAYNVRRATYWSLLSGPVAGVTYGGHGVWSWHAKPGEEPTDHKGTGVAKVWKDALDLPGAAQMGHVRTLVESLPWTELRPGSYHKQEGDDPAKFVACAYSAKSGVYVFYFPAGAKAHILLHIRGIEGSVRWFNPRTGTWGRPANPLPGRGALDPPDDEDWVVVVKP